MSKAETEQVTKDILHEIRNLGLNMERVLRKKISPPLKDLEGVLTELKLANKILIIEELHNGK